MAKQKPNNKTDPDSAMTVLEHLAELRTRVMRAVIVLIALFLLCYAFSGKLLMLLGRPLEEALRAAQTEQLAKQQANPETASATSSNNTISQSSNPEAQKFSCSCLPFEKKDSGRETDLGTKGTAPTQRTNPPNASTEKGQHSQAAEKPTDRLKTQPQTETKATPSQPDRSDQKRTDLTPAPVEQNLSAAKPSNNGPLQTSLEAPAANLSSKPNLSHLNCYCEKVAPAPEKKQSLFVFLGLTEVFFSEIKIAFWLALFFAVPYLFVEIWGFVAPAMYKKEKKLVFWLFVGTFVCFIGGSLFSYFVVFPLGFHFFLSMASFDLVTPNLSIAQYLDFALVLIFMFGVVFELPMVCIALALLDLISAPAMIRQSRIAILIIFVVSGIITPPDPLSMILMALPLTGLYFVSYIFVGMLKGFRSPKERAV